jgi:hypothetical protein
VPDTASKAGPYASARPHNFFVKSIIPHCPAIRGGTVAYKEGGKNLEIIVLIKKHPHVGGENGKPSVAAGPEAETPPRGWGKRPTGG